MAVFIKREYDYAIRICAYLSNFYKKEYLSVPEVSKKLFLTVPFTTKIVYQLKKKNIIETIQGKFGGIRLKSDPTKLTFYDILFAMGFDMTINECVKNPRICPLVDHCKTHNYFIDQERMIVDNLKNATINDYKITDDDLS